METFVGIEKTEISMHKMYWGAIRNNAYEGIGKIQSKRRSLTMMNLSQRFQPVLQGALKLGPSEVS